ncbi:LOW QUALITY PROTEIN: cytochrome P450 6k1-like [Chelonus insularis]|uniref:LOW QUALITY PROTEIN: cytochrome P450 6k1-like n=1 Tax=Chelonus insularis TaxID=460826 RepID=UPI00158CBC54|nr:LOW QUALITY PROTEIN: cytochrome P450 6k1-like [Chelonus insularis]
MKFELEVFLIVIVLLLLLFYYWSSFKHTFWKNIGVPGPRPLPFVGNFGPFFFGRKSLIEVVKTIYDDWKNEPFIGIYNSRVPVLIINDLNLVRQVLIKDFNVFPGRGIKINEKDEPLSNNIFSLDGHRWKIIRAKLTPAFTTGKLKQMVTLMVECAEHFEKYLLNNVHNGDIVECREEAAKFTTDIIGSCAFGINMNALEKEDSEFRKMGRKVFESSIYNMARRILRDVAPKLFKILGLRTLSENYVNFFINSIKETMEMREKYNIVRHDLVDILQDMYRNKHEIDFEITETLLTAQAFVFFAAGFETSSTTISFALYELAIATEVQEKLRIEIMETLKKHQGKLSYEIINEMKYLNMVVQETLRKNPPGVLLRRETTVSYTIPGSKVTIPAGTMVHIPIYCFHHDERYFLKPEKFEPERFMEENQRHPMSYLPFGDGPKNCIGARFAIYQSKLGLIAILKHFRVRPSKFTIIPYKIDKTAFVLAPAGGVKLKFDLINN